MRNVEIKARCSNWKYGEIKKILEAEGTFIGKGAQKDTYFRTNEGRLKLREGSLGNYLVSYYRGNEKGPKKSEVSLLEMGSEEMARSIREVLGKSLKIWVVVKKIRSIYSIGNVKFHLDIVGRLGLFVEIEAQDPKGKIGISKLEEQCNHYMELFNISEEDLVRCSYSDLVYRLGEEERI